MMRTCERCRIDDLRSSAIATPGVRLAGHPARGVLDLHRLDRVWFVQLDHPVRGGPSAGARRRSSAMPGALQYAEELAPWAYGVPVLMSHDPRNLVQMGQIVHGPCAKQL